MTTELWLRDPTAETAPLERARAKPPQSLDGLTIAWRRASPSGISR